MVDSGCVEKFSIPLVHTLTAQPTLKFVDHINWNKKTITHNTDDQKLKLTVKDFNLK